MVSHARQPKRMLFFVLGTRVVELDVERAAVHGNLLLAAEASEHVRDDFARAVGVLREIRIADRHEDFMAMTHGHVDVQPGPLHSLDVF